MNATTIAQSQAEAQAAPPAGGTSRYTILDREKPSLRQLATRWESLLAMLLVFSLALGGHVTAEHALGVEMLSWYWHFVDAVWVVIFTIVYVVGR